MKRHADSYLNMADTKMWWHTKKKKKKKARSLLLNCTVVSFSNLIFSAERIPTFPQTHATIWGKKRWSCTGSRSASQPCITTKEEDGPNSTYCKPNSSDTKKKEVWRHLVANLSNYTAVCEEVRQWLLNSQVPVYSLLVTFFPVMHTQTYKNNMISVTLLNEKLHHAFFLMQI